MGLACSGEQQIHLTHVPYKILMLGDSGAGKTQLLYSLKVGNKSVVQPIPTEEFNVERVQTLSGKWFTIWDLSGSQSFKVRRRQFYMGSEGIIFVVDSTDAGNIERTKAELFSVLQELDLTGIPLLIVANKQDLSGAMEVSDLEKRLGLGTLTNRKWRIVGTCARDDRSAQAAMIKLEELYQFISTKPKI